MRIFLLAEWISETFPENIFGIWRRRSVISVLWKKLLENEYKWQENALEDCDSREFVKKLTLKEKVLLGRFIIILVLNYTWQFKVKN